MRRALVLAACALAGFCAIPDVVRAQPFEGAAPACADPPPDGRFADEGVLYGVVSDAPDRRGCLPQWRAFNVGPNSRVGSGARNSQRAANAVRNVVGGLLGGGGGGGSNGPDLVRCRLGDRDSTVFTDAASGVALRVGARQGRNGVEVYAGVEQSPDNGTFQAAFLENAGGEALAPTQLGVCRLWGEWRLQVSWTRSTYQNGGLVDRRNGGWSRAGTFDIPGLQTSAARPDGLWRRLGFSNASHGARQVAMQYRLSPADLAAGPLRLVIHVTRPGADPVTTAPFVLLMTPGPRGYSFTREDCPVR